MLSIRKALPIFILFALLATASCAGKKPVTSDSGEKAGVSSSSTTSSSTTSSGTTTASSSRKEKEPQIDHLKNAQSAFDMGDYVTARSEASKFIEVNPTSSNISEAQYLIARCYIKEGREENARSEFERFIANYPQDKRAAAARYEIARSYFRQGKSEEGRAELKKYQTQYSSNPEAAQAQYDIAASYLGENRDSDARREFSILINTYPQSEYAGEGSYRIALANLREGREDEARKGLENFIRAYPQSSHVAEANSVLRSLEAKRMQELASLRMAQERAMLDQAKQIQDAVKDMRLTASKGRNYVLLDLKHNVVLIKNGSATLYAFPCATGKGFGILSATGKGYKFNTPIGKHTIKNKNVDPIWVRPNWYWLEQGREVPEGITGTERSMEGHLGKYSIGIGDGIYFHGYAGIVKPGKITHGCIRLNQDDLEIFFNMVEVGTEVYIF